MAVALPTQPSAFTIHQLSWGPGCGGLAVGAEGLELGERGAATALSESPCRLTLHTLPAVLLGVPFRDHFRHCPHLSPSCECPSARAVGRTSAHNLWRLGSQAQGAALVMAQHMLRLHHQGDSPRMSTIGSNSACPITVHVQLTVCVFRPSSQMRFVMWGLVLSTTEELMLCGVGGGTLEPHSCPWVVAKLVISLWRLYRSTSFHLGPGMAVPRSFITFQAVQ